MQQSVRFEFGLQSGLPPSTDARTVLQRADEVGTILRMLSSPQTCTLVMTGDPGAGKSTLAALVFRHLQTLTQTGSLAMRHFVWLRLSPYATIPAVVAAILDAISASTPGTGYAPSLPADLQSLRETLRRPHESAFVVLDQLEELLEGDIESEQQPTFYASTIGQRSLALFLEMLLQDLGGSRVLLTCTRSPYGNNPYDETQGVRGYLVSRVSIPEGVALLLQRNVIGTQQELSLVWQRCAGHVYALALCSALVNLSSISLSYLLNSPDFQSLWNGDVTQSMVGAVCAFLNPIQRALTRALCLFNEPVPLAAVMASMTGEEASGGTDTQLFGQELDLLAEFSLVQRVTRPGGEKLYLLHTLLRMYTLAHYLSGNQNNTGSLGVANEPDVISSSAEARRVAIAAGHMRIAGYYQRMAQRFCPPRPARSGLNDVTLLLSTIAHLCPGWHWQVAYNLLTREGLDEDLERWGNWHDLIRLYEMMFPPPNVLTPGDEGLVCSALGLLYGRLDEPDVSSTYYTRALALQREIADYHGAAITLTNQGELLRAQDKLPQARANFEQALLLNKQQTDPLLECVLLHNIGLLSQQEKDYPQAMQYYLESLRLARQVQDQAKEGMILTNTGMLLYEQGRLPEALSLLLHALQLRQVQRDPTIYSLIAFLNLLEQKMGAETFTQLRQSAQAQGSHEDVLRKVAV